MIYDNGNNNITAKDYSYCFTLLLMVINHCAAKKSDEFK